MKLKLSCFVPYKTHLHVPKIHLLTRSIFFERDQGHVLNVLVIKLIIITNMAVSIFTIVREDVQLHT